VFPGAMSCGSWSSFLPTFFQGVAFLPIAGNYSSRLLLMVLMSADNAIDVQRHYDQKPSTSIEERAKLETVDLKTFNNWIKAALIEAVS